MVGPLREGGGKPPEPLEKNLSVKKNNQTSWNTKLERRGGVTLTLVVRPLKKHLFMCVFPKGELKWTFLCLVFYALFQISYIEVIYRIFSDIWTQE